MPELTSTLDTGLKAGAARIISTALADGDLRHPNRPNVPLMVPGLHTTAHPDPQVVDAINEITHMLGEALIDTVLRDLDAELIRKTDLDALRTAAANAKPSQITLTCRHRDLLKIAVKAGTDKAEIRCDRLRANLTECRTT